MNNLIEIRNRHYLNACLNIIRHLDPREAIDLQDIAMRAAKSPAPRYYCTFDYALRMLRVLRHGRLKLRNDRRTRMWNEINTKVDGLMRKKGVSLIDALAHLLAVEPASEFFISPATAYHLVLQLRARNMAS